MSRKLTIIVSDDVYDGLQRHVGKRGIGRFIDSVVGPRLVGLESNHAVDTSKIVDVSFAHVDADLVNAALDVSYKAKAAAELADANAPSEAQDWCEAGLDEGLPDDDWSDLMTEFPPVFDQVPR